MNGGVGLPKRVLHPPVLWKDYDVGDRGVDKSLLFVTMINCNTNKGGYILPRIAEHLPELRFVGVRGAYEEQIIKPAANLKYLPNTPCIKNIYAQTRILLIPSAYESWGRVAVEAMSSGIPVIATATPGLSEALGSAGIFCDREDIPSWTSHIRRLVEDEAYYAAVSRRCRARSRELDPRPQMNELEQWLTSLAERPVGQEELHVGEGLVFH